MKNKLILVAGCSGSGKTTVSSQIKNSFKKGQAQIICLDRFYKANRDNKFPKVRATNDYNFDHPNAFDWKLVRKCIKDLLNNKATEIPRYNYYVSKREKKGEIVKPTKIIILEGTLPLYDEELREMASFKLFVKTPLDFCLIRRIERDQKTRGRSLESILKRWQTAVSPMYTQFVYPTKNIADLIIPWITINTEGLKVILPALQNLVK